MIRQKTISQGTKAVLNGRNVEGIIQNYLSLAGYNLLRDCKHISMMLASRQHLFPERGYYAKQCCVPLTAVYHNGRSREARADFVVYTPAGELVLISSKSQHSDGSAEEKLEYELQQLIATQQHAAMLIHGPVKGRDGATGWSLEVLQQIWERVRYYGNDRVLLFRSPEKLSVWIRDGLPVSGRGVRPSDIFAQYCDREP